eukprot:1160556-Pelagomonas_calceolata.AAC.2
MNCALALWIQPSLFFSVWNAHSTEVAWCLTPTIPHLCVYAVSSTVRPARKSADMARTMVLVLPVPGIPSTSA